MGEGEWVRIRERGRAKNVVKGSRFFPNQFPCLFCRFQVLRDKPKGEKLSWL
ncbi:hypothetical protein COLO4_32840 [Corchorus olitorius]|uniref:Uncharacterized protein n=1 Tax=Corchorus olitorius TaxID=93759 RepID=A0A1R3GY17_9ROSI|nr:hypothetical protein COLO4_32840 [Corchorus olitorius]